MNTMTNNPTAAQETLTTGLKQKSRSKWVANFAKTQILKRLHNLQVGRLTIIDGQEKHVFGQTANDKVDSIEATIHSFRFTRTI